MEEPAVTAGMHAKALWLSGTPAACERGASDSNFSRYAWGLRDPKLKTLYLCVRRGEIS